MSANNQIREYLIWATGDRATVEVPLGAQILSVGQTNDFAGGSRLVVWALVDVTKPVQKRRVWVVETNSPTPARLASRKFVGSVTLRDRTTWHVFEEASK